MKKQLILLRHAKSVSHFTASDFNRTLNEKGRKDVPQIAEAFKKLSIEPSIILCSTAARTKETHHLFINSIALKTPTVFIDELYHASASEMFDIIANYTEQTCIMVVGHNFGISNLANQLSCEGAQEMNTCGLYILEFSEGIEWNKGTILNYLSPKNI